MLPDFPNIKHRLENIRYKYILQLTRQDPLFSQIKQEEAHEGRHIQVIEAGKTNPSVLKDKYVRCEIDKNDIVLSGMKAFLDGMYKQAEEMTKFKHELLHDFMDEITKSTGNRVDAKGKEFTFDLFIETIEKIDMDFDDNGKPYMPTLVISPDMAIKVKQELANIENDPLQKERFDKLINKKKEEWHVRESNRKLVD